MIDDQPIMEQLEELDKFIKSNKVIYIYGDGYIQKMIYKYLIMSGNSISAFITDSENECTPTIKINQLSHKRINKHSGVIIATEDANYNKVINELQKYGINNFFIVTEHNKRTIAFKMTPRKTEDFLLEVNLADHCNLNCQMCDHFSPIAEKVFYDLKEFDSDMKRMSELTNNTLGLIKLQGGEPLLNDNLIDYIKITRKYFPYTRVWLFTAGVLLLNWENHKNGNLWKACKDFNIEIQLTRYPINLDFKKIEKKACEYGVILNENTNIGDSSFTGTKFSVRHPFDLKGNVETFRFICCYQFNESIVMNHGKIYACPMKPYVKYFNNYFKQNLEVSEEDYINIYDVNSFDEISEFVTHRTNFCRYCKTHMRDQHVWSQSEHNISEWAD